MNSTIKELEGLKIISVELGQDLSNEGVHAPNTKFNYITLKTDKGTFTFESCPNCSGIYIRKEESK